METKPQQLIMSSLTRLPWFYQIYPLQLMVNKGKIKGGSGFSSLPHQEQQLGTGFTHRAMCSSVSGICISQDLLSQATPEAQILLLLCNWSNQQPSSGQQMWNCSSHPRARQDGFGAALSSTCAASSSSSSPTPWISEPKLTSLRVKCPPAMPGVGAEVVFGVGGARMVPGQVPLSLCTRGCGCGSGVCVLHTMAPGHDELPPRHWVILSPKS